MAELFWKLFWEFFKTGLFAMGGGLATIPFLYEMMDKYHWFTAEDLMNMIAISESTPGPMGVNMATYVGFHSTGNNPLGGIIATLGLVMPSVIVICVIARVLQTYKNNPYVQNAFFGLRPAVCAMIATAGIGVLTTVLMPTGSLVIDSTFWIHLVLLGIFLVFAFKFKKLHPIVLICIAAVTGIVLQL